jgi:pentatricopeptide repeat protein
MRIHASSIVGTVSERDVAVGNALISMYGRHGSVEEARRAFDRMPTRDVVSWSAVIDCYAQHGRSEDALRMFEQLLQQREQQPPVEPDQAALLSVLGACSHAGAIAEGWHCFASMERGFVIKPTVDHYNCVLDMLGRAGMVEAAESVIWDMPLAADTVSWLTLLCACRQHADVERGHRAARRALALDPSCLVAYTVLSNVYSAADRLQDEEPSAL